MIWIFFKPSNFLTKSIPAGPWYFSNLYLKLLWKFEFIVINPENRFLSGEQRTCIYDVRWFWPLLTNLRHQMIFSSWLKIFWGFFEPTYPKIWRHIWMYLLEWKLIKVEEWIVWWFCLEVPWIRNYVKIQNEVDTFWPRHLTGLRLKLKA